MSGAGCFFCVFLERSISLGHLDVFLGGLSCVEKIVKEVRGNLCPAPNRKCMTSAMEEGRDFACGSQGLTTISDLLLLLGGKHPKRLQRGRGICSWKSLV